MSAGEQTHDELPVVVDWPYVEQQITEALEQPDALVTIHRAALSLALVALRSCNELPAQQQATTPAPDGEPSAAFQELWDAMGRADDAHRAAIDRRAPLGVRGELARAYLDACRAVRTYVAGLEADAARLDWLAEQEVWVNPAMKRAAEVDVTLGWRMGDEPGYGAFRNLIDSARALNAEGSDAR